MANFASKILPIWILAVLMVNTVKTKNTFEKVGQYVELWVSAVVLILKNVCNFEIIIIHNLNSVLFTFVIRKINIKRKCFYWKVLQKCILEHYHCYKVNLLL